MHNYSTMTIISDMVNITIRHHIIFNLFRNIDDVLVLLLEVNIFESIFG